jgi:alanine racemase
LRRTSIDAPILVMSYMPAWQAHEAIIHKVSATVFSLELARAFNRAATELNQMAHIHVKVDTGMGPAGAAAAGCAALPTVNSVSQLEGRGALHSLCHRR